MGYMKIPNLYKDNRILDFKWCYATEKVHGTSAHVRYVRNPAMFEDRGGTTVPVQVAPENDGLTFFSGGAKHDQFVRLFGDPDSLSALHDPAKFPILEACRVSFPWPGTVDVTVYGEAYGGKMQGMRDTYGPDLRFIVFEVKVGDSWLSVPDAADVALKLGLEFVPFHPVETSLASIDAYRDEPSQVAIRRGIEEPRIKEGIVLRPPFEVRVNNGGRIIAKYKRPEFAERASKADADPDAKQAKLDGVKAAQEWVTPMRIDHVLMALGDPPMGTATIAPLIDAMLKDIETEAGPEVDLTRETRKEIARLTATMYKAGLEAALKGFA